jgi:hypothetical protein
MSKKENAWKKWVKIEGETIQIVKTTVKILRFTFIDTLTCP